MQGRISVSIGDLRRWGWGSGAARGKRVEWLWGVLGTPREQCMGGFWEHGVGWPAYYPSVSILEPTVSMLQNSSLLWPRNLLIWVQDPPF